MAQEPVEVTVQLDPATARWLQTCTQRDGSMAAAAAEQLRTMAIAARSRPGRRLLRSAPRLRRRRPRGEPGGPRRGRDRLT